MTYLTLIKKWEGFRSKPYMDVVGIWTIGYGTLIKDPNGRPYRGEAERDVVYALYPEPISESTASEILDEEIDSYVKCVDKHAKNCTPNQRDALISLCYNIGTTAFKNSTLLKHHNSGQRLPTSLTRDIAIMKSQTRESIPNAPDQFIRWSYANGRWVKGLFNRRLEERSVYIEEPTTNAG